MLCVVNEDCVNPGSREPPRRATVRNDLGQAPTTKGHPDAADRAETTRIGRAGDQAPCTGAGISHAAGPARDAPVTFFRGACTSRCPERLRRDRHIASPAPPKKTPGPGALASSATKSNPNDPLHPQHPDEPSSLGPARRSSQKKQRRADRMSARRDKKMASRQLEC